MLSRYLARRSAPLVGTVLDAESIPLEYWPATIRGCSACLRNELPLVYLDRRTDPALCEDCLREMLEFLRREGRDE